MATKKPAVKVIEARKQYDPIHSPIYYEDGKMLFKGGSNQKIERVSERMGRLTSGIKVEKSGDKWQIVRL